MTLGFTFFLNSALLGVGLAMDAFSVSLANGLGEPNMRRAKQCGIAGVFGAFQAIMPMIGWFIVSMAVGVFSVLEKYIPVAALLIFLFIGGKMVLDGVRGGEEESGGKLGFWALILQGIATSIDALSVGFTISEYNFIQALVSALIIAAVTFVICMAGLAIGKKFGTRLAGKAEILGGVILIAIGIEIFVSGFFG